MTELSQDETHKQMEQQQQQQQQQQRQRQWLLGHIKIPLIPTSFDLSALTKLDLPNLGLTELPSCLPEICPSLSILFCPKNEFVEVPPVIGKCPNLQMISFKECHTIESIHPEALQPQLRWLILTGNKISKIPDTIGRCHKLQKFMLSGNNISELPRPEILAELKNLELIRLACNQLTTPPVELLEACPNLRWAAFAGNPFLMATATTKESMSSKGLPILDDPVLDDDSWPVLGKGAGGVTRRVPWNGRDVAVKTFAGELTSDGSPQDEKAISKLVTSTTATTANANGGTGTSAAEPALIELLGETKEGGALVMEFLEGYSALAGPPSFFTCSRDVYCEASRAALEGFSLWKIATDTLRVLSKLHGLGVSHSDFYAHNILIQPNTNTHSVKVSDFGAAFRYRCNNNDNNDDDKFGKLVETVEVRAYAVLVEELFKLTETIIIQDTEERHPWKELLKECHTNGATFRALAKKFHS